MQQLSNTIVAGNTAATAPENRIFYPALDGLRTVAFLLVFGQHYYRLPWGWCGVNIFFVLSGFLITGILYDSRDDQYRARNFYIRRTLRIFPLFYTVLLLIAMLWFCCHWQWNWKWLAWPAYLGNFMHFSPYKSFSPGQRLADAQLVGSFHGHTFTLFLGHFWSLCIEEQFYLVWPWVIFMVRDRRKLLWICGLALPVGLCLRVLAQHILPSWMVAQNVLSRFTPLSCDALVLGGFLAMLLRSSASNKTLQLARVALLPTLLVGLGYVFATLGNRPWQLYNYPNWTETFGFTFVDVLGALLLLNAIQPGTWLFKLLDRDFVRWAGRISYGAYVIHDIPHAFFVRLAGHAPRLQRTLAGTLALITTYLFAWISFRFYESRFLNLKERLTIRT